MKRLLCHIVLLLGFLPLTIAETIVVGTVTDARTGQPIENANIYYRGTQTGCASNSEGLFMLRTELTKKRTLVISAVGYKSQHYPIEPDSYMGVEILMEEKNTILDEVLLVPGNNPALPLMEQVRRHRGQNDITQNTGYSYDLTEDKQLYISDIRQRHLQRYLWKSLQKGMLQAEDSTYLLPLYRSRGIYRLTNNQRIAIEQPEEQSTLLTETDYSVLLGGNDKPLNFYHNTLTIFGKTFVSPLSSTGNSYYRYYLADSIGSGTEKNYLLHFKSKNPYLLSFNGEMLIDSATYALRHISVSVPREVSINYLSALQIQQTYNQHNALATEDFSTIFDFAVKSDTSHIFPTVLLTKHLRGTVQEIPFTQPALSTDTLRSAFADSMAVAAMDSLSRLPIVKIVKFAAEIINTGYIPTGTCIDVGNITDIASFNPQETVGIGLPLRTNAKLWKNVSLEAYASYGFRDQAWKGKGQIQVQLPTDRRHIIGAKYHDRYVRSEVNEMTRLSYENSIGYGDMSFTTWLMENLYTNPHAVNSATRRRELMLWTENDWTDNIETRFSVQVGHMGYGDPMAGYHKIPSYKFKTLSGMVRLGWQERKVDGYFRRVHIAGHYPTVYAYIEGGSYQTAQMVQEELYGKLSLMVRQKVNLGICGELDYMAQAGIIVGKVPYPLLEIMNGNQSYSFDPYRFTLMNQYQFAADKYLLLHAHWNMQGLIFNRIPGIRYLRLRELLELKMAYGGLSAKHQTVVPFPAEMQSLRIPYVEIGVGIGNILRVLDLYAVGRVTHLKDPNAPYWGIRFRLNLGL